MVLLVGSATATLLAFPWSRDMFRSRAIMPQTQMFLPAPNTLAIGHARILDRIDAEDLLANPVAVSPEVLEEAGALFATYCAVCHGANGRRPGPVGRRFDKVPDLSDPAIQSYPDGLLYSVIREGGFAMPGYAEALTASERWALVHFIRSLNRP
jgi:mono/diheme cytochrome c family protein